MSANKYVFDNADGTFDLVNDAENDITRNVPVEVLLAAPTLVEALRELVAACPITFDYHGFPLDPELGAALDNAEAALRTAGVNT